MVESRRARHDAEVCEVRKLREAREYVGIRYVHSIEGEVLESVPTARYEWERLRLACERAKGKTDVLNFKGA